MKFSGDWGRKAIHALEGVGLFVFPWVNDGLTTYDVFWLMIVFLVNDYFFELMMFFWV